MKTRKAFLPFFLSLAIPLLAAGVSRNSQAATLFPNPAFPVGDGVSSMATADFDGDGLPDVVTANQTTHDLSLLLGLGDGTFRPERRIVVGISPRSVVVADINNDGHQDIALTAHPSGGVTILLGQGDGTFGPQTTFSYFNVGGVLAAADLNADGFEDLVVTDNISGTLSVLIGGADGIVRRFATYFVGFGFTSVTFAEINHDGAQDLVVAYAGLSGSGGVTILLGLGDGTFEPGGTPLAGGRPGPVAIGDVDSDARQDLAVADTTSYSVWVFQGLGDGTFGDGNRYETPFPVRSIILGDLDGDGDQDLTMVSDSGLLILRGLGDGTFGDASSFVAALGLAVAEDFDADGRKDLALARSSDVAILRDTGDATFGLETHFGTGCCPRSGAVADFDGDGIADLTVANPGSAFFGLDGDLLVFQGRGDGTFGPSVHLASGLMPYSVAAGDFNADGHPDLAASSLGNAALDAPEGVLVLLGRGDGTFDSPLRFDAGVRPSAVVIADVNGDGRQDLMVANRGSYDLDQDDDVSVLSGLGDGTFGAQARFRVGREPGSVAVGDFNHDGRPDLVVANTLSHDLSVLLGSAVGVFRPETRLTLSGAPFSVAVTDFNGDGAQDVALATVGPGEEGVTVLLGFGDGTFGPERRFRTGDMTSAVAAGDVNGDGLQDLVVGNRFPDALSVLIGQGDGTFDPPASFVAASAFVTMGDLNRDGRRDLVGVSEYGFSVLLNQGPFANRAPLADAGPELQTECTSRDGATVTLNGTASTDPDSSAGTNDDIVSFEWLENFGQPSEIHLGIGRTMSVTLSLGVHVVTLKVTDAAGATDEDEVLVAVLDTTPPSLILTATPALLWPPNHRMVPVHVGREVEDACDTSISVILVEATSSEPEDAPGGGDGSTPNDVQGAATGTSDFLVGLRAERAAGGSGRRYSLTYNARDSAGNVCVSTAVIDVPQSLSHRFDDD